jgi:NADPH:quinone reductase-like Zn-dependent oxidoreductase
MKAIVRSQYGSAEVLHFQEVAPPGMPDDRSVLVRVRGASVHAGDWHLLRGTPFLIRFIYGGLRRPNIQILGTDMAGEVEIVGKAVTQFQPGDAVFGDLSEAGFGTFAEYVCVPETALAAKPTNLSFAEAATIPVSALTALQGLRDVGQLQAGQKVLINGASGGVGSFAVQIAKAFGAEVTGMCSAAKAEMVRSQGADHILDYTQTDLSQYQQNYDLILDAAAYRSVFDYLPTLVPNGTYVMVGGSTPRLFLVLLFGGLMTKISRRHVKCLMQKPNQQDLIILKDLIEANKIRPYIDCHYPLSKVSDAIRHIEGRQVKGKVAISV